MSDDSLEIVCEYILSHSEARWIMNEGTVEYEGRVMLPRSQWSKVYECTVVLLWSQGSKVYVLCPCGYIKVLTFVNALMSVVLHVVCGGAQCRRKSNGVNEWCLV